MILNRFQIFQRNKKRPGKGNKKNFFLRQSLGRLLLFSSAFWPTQVWKFDPPPPDRVQEERRLPPPSLTLRGGHFEEDAKDPSKPPKALESDAKLQERVKSKESLEETDGLIESPLARAEELEKQIHRLNKEIFQLLQENKSLRKALEEVDERQRFLATEVARFKYEIRYGKPQKDSFRDFLEEQIRYKYPPLQLDDGTEID